MEGQAKVQKKGMVVVLKDYFGYRPTNPQFAGMSQEEFDKLSYQQKISAGGAKGFLAELKALTDKEKAELAWLAAAELGLTQEQVNFQL
ncbi:MAG: hypothetical protein HYT12_03925 [Candidatus Liptonbacteria bacterium]|nr:hypothetical protein [Candidatus Liptonbacteria bacterium]